MSEALDVLLQDGVIEAVLGRLKTGKEAEVWLVQHAGTVAAAKVYKERHERNFKNNAGYREGRDVRNSRTRRAIAKGSRFGQAAADEAWKSAEADTLEVLYTRGVRVPTPISFYEGVLVMELVLDAEGQPAPRLVELPPQTPQEARAVYLDLRQQVVRMLAADLIHGDLSAFNVLAAANGPTIIDFPQTLVAARNNQAEGYFRRDVENIRTFLAAIDPELHAFSGDASSIWSAYVRRELTPDFVPRGGGAPRGAPGRRGVLPPAAARPRPSEPVAEPSKPLDPEAELRELEAKFLRQGGGERGKPPAAPPQRGARRGRAGGGGGFGRGPQQGQKPQGGRPQQGRPGPAGGGNPRGAAPPAQTRTGTPQQAAGPRQGGGRPPERGGPQQGRPPDQSGQQHGRRPRHGGPQQGGQERPGGQQQGGQPRPGGQQQGGQPRPGGQQQHRHPAGPPTQGPPQTGAPHDRRAQGDRGQQGRPGAPPRQQAPQQKPGPAVSYVSRGPTTRPASSEGAPPSAPPSTDKRGR